MLLVAVPLSDVPLMAVSGDDVDNIWLSAIFCLWRCPVVKRRDFISVVRSRVAPPSRSFRISLNELVPSSDCTWPFSPFVWNESNLPSTSSSMYLMSWLLPVSVDDGLSIVIGRDGCFFINSELYELGQAEHSNHFLPFFDGCFTSCEYRKRNRLTAVDHWSSLIEDCSIWRLLQ